MATSRKRIIKSRILMQPKTSIIAIYPYQTDPARVYVSSERAMWTKSYISCKESRIPTKLRIRSYLLMKRYLTFHSKRGRTPITSVSAGYYTYLGGQYVAVTCLRFLLARMRTNGHKL